MPQFQTSSMPLLNSFREIKVGLLSRLRCKTLNVFFIVLVIAMLLILAWENCPYAISFLPLSESLNMLSPGSVLLVPHQESLYMFGSKYTESQHPSKEADYEMSSYGNSSEKVDQILVYPPPVSPLMARSYELIEKEENLSGFSEKNACNYAKGKWVADSRRPLYSGLGCKQWLSGMWACRLMERKDFSYEHFRWQPKGCDMPDFEGSNFLRRMQDKTIAFVGDSLGRQQFQSLMCMVTGGLKHPEVKDVGREYRLAKAPGAIRPDGWVYRFPSTNTTILFYWSASLCELEPFNRSDLATSYAMHLDRPATFLVTYLHRFDVLILNTGHHWNKGKIKGNRWEMYVGGKPINNPKLADIGNAKNFTIYNVAKWLDSQLLQYPWIEVFFRTISPRHFAGGDWNTGGSCGNTIPLKGGAEVVQDASSDNVVEGALKGTGVKILDITALSQLRDEAHISKYSSKSSEGVQDCLHWCLPGIPDTWNEILAALI